MACPGSVALTSGLVDNESEHASLGTAAHALAETLLNTGADAWQAIGTEFQVDKDMADAVQVYLDAVREAHVDRHQGNFFVERRFHCPELHEKFYGTSDCVYLDEPFRHLHVWDYKHGAGIVVEAEKNPQMMYYASGVIEDLGLWDKVEQVTLHIAQPRAWHWDGPVREYAMSITELESWLFDVLLPAMDKALSDDGTTTKSGEHCRFCPARGRACPQILADIDEMEKLMKEMSGKTAAELTNEQLGRFGQLFEGFKIANKAHGEVIFGRLQAGQQVPNHKLVPARSNREWKPEADKEVRKALGNKALTDPQLKSPAEVDKLPGGKALTARYAFKPDKGLTVAFDSDTRPAVSRDTKSLFTNVTKKGKK